MALGDLADMGLASNTPPGLIQQLMEFFYVSSNFPFWFVIVGSTVAVRLSFLPWILSQRQKSERFQEVAPTWIAHSQRVQGAREAGDLNAVDRYQKKMLKLLRKSNTSPYSLMALPLIQIPVMASFYLSLKGMASVPVPQMQMGGLLWFKDLTIADPYHILPILSYFSMMTVYEVCSESQRKVSPVLQKSAWPVRIIASISLPITWNFPTGLFVYWLASNVFTIFMQLALGNPRLQALYKKWRGKAVEI